MHCTGWTWLSDVDLDATTASTSFVNPPTNSCRATSQARIKELTESGEVAIVETEGVSALAVVPLLNGYSTTGSGGSGALCRVYGGIGFGEPRLTEYDKNPIIWCCIGVLYAATIGSGAATICTTNVQGSAAEGENNLLMTNPITGTEYSCFINSENNAVQDAGEVSSTIYSLTQNQQAHPGSPVGEGFMYASSAAGIPMGFIPSVHLWQKVAFCFNEGSATFLKANALICKWT